MSKGRSVSNTVSNIRADNPPPIHLTGFQGLRIHGHFPPSSAVKFAAVKLRLATHRARTVGMVETLERCSYAPSRRGGFWVYIRRVPKAFAPYDGRGVVKLSTGIRIADDPKGVRAATAVCSASPRATPPPLRATRGRRSPTCRQAAASPTPTGYRTFPAPCIPNVAVAPAAEARTQLLRRGR